MKGTKDSIAIRPKTRHEHLEWCKQRALEYIDRGNTSQAYASICSDLSKHPETESHPAMSLGMSLMMGEHLNTLQEMRKFIDGFK